MVPQPVVVAVLPEYQPKATMATQRDLVDRALFNPTRRPAPVAPADAGKKRLQAGQFVLTGTLIIDGKATAFLRENAGGKSRRVAQGEQVNGMTVAEVKPDRVKLTMGDESEDLVLKVAAGPKFTTQPVTTPPVAAGVPVELPAAPRAPPRSWRSAAARNRSPTRRRPPPRAGRRCSTRRRPGRICRPGTAAAAARRSKWTRAGPRPMRASVRGIRRSTARPAP